MTLCEHAGELQSLLKDDLEKFELQLRVGMRCVASRSESATTMMSSSDSAAASPRAR